MNKQIIYALLCGALFFSTVSLSSCSDNEVDDLKSRVTVVEGMIREVKDLLENLPAGSTITNATQKDGIWTLVLSSGQTITINPSEGGGGSSLELLEKENSIVITVDGKDYELPLGAGFHSLLYIPEFTDGETHTNSMGRATIKLLVKPALTAATLENATFTIGAANELKTRSVRSFFSVDGDVTLDGEYINVPLRTLDVEAAGKIFAVALQMNLGSATYISNNFNLVVSSDYTGTPEDVIDAKLIEAITDYTELENGFSTATIPEPTVDVLGSFNFKDLFSELPEGVIRFELAGAKFQNNNVANQLDVFRDALSADGTWELKARPGTNGDAPADSEQNSGILINVIANDVIKHKIYWKIVDQVAAIPDADFIGGFKPNQHIEYPEDRVWEKGARLYNLNKEFTTETNFLAHGDNGVLETFKTFGVMLNEEDLIYNDGEELQLGSIGNKYAKYSQGLHWNLTQPSVASSQRRNLDIPAEEKGNGEIIGGWDGFPTQELWDTFGVRTAGPNIEMSENYDGHCVRLGMRLQYEYVYGTRYIGGKTNLVFFWINRRVSPADVTDPAPR